MAGLGAESFSKVMLSGFVCGDSTNKAVGVIPALTLAQPRVYNAWPGSLSVRFQRIGGRRDPGSWGCAPFAGIAAAKPANKTLL